MITGRAMSAGDLRETILIKSFSEAQSGTGEVTSTASTLFSARAKVEPLRGAEFARMQLTQAQSDYRITIRKRGTTVEPEYQVVWGSKTLDVQSVIDIGAEGRWIELTCKERFD
jgi:SPP1 family predicted phage head-tail adaptor